MTKVFLFDWKIIWEEDTGGDPNGAKPQNEINMTTVISKNNVFFFQKSSRIIKKSSSQEKYFTII